MTRQSSSPSCPDIYVLVARGTDGGAVSDHLSAPPINKKDTLAAVLRGFLKLLLESACTTQACEHVCFDFNGA